MKKYILFAIIAVSMAACSDYSYPEDKKISERNGALVDSAATYLLEDLTYGGTTYTMNWNETKLNYLNTYMLETSEPVLYNYYLERSVYRLVVAEKNKMPLILSVNKSKNKAWIVSKRLKHGINDVDTTNTSLLKLDYDNYSRDLTKDESQKFDSIWSATNFYTLQSVDINKEQESFYLLEAHEKGKYWYVYSPSNNTELEEVATYIRSLTGF